MTFIGSLRFERMPMLMILYWQTLSTTNNFFSAQVVFSWSDLKWLKTDMEKSQNSSAVFRIKLLQAAVHMQVRTRSLRHIFVRKINAFLFRFIYSIRYI